MEMLAEVKVAIGQLPRDVVAATGETLVEVIRFVLANYPEHADEVNGNDPRVLVGAFRFVMLNDEIALSRHPVRFPDGEPLNPLEKPWRTSFDLKAPVKHGDEITICRMLCG